MFFKKNKNIKCIKKEQLLTEGDILTAMNDGASYEARLVVEGIGSSVVCSSR